MGSGPERLDGCAIHEDAGEYAVSRKDTDADTDPGGATHWSVAPAGAHENGLGGMPVPGVVTPGKCPAPRRGARGDDCIDPGVAETTRIGGYRRLWRALGAILRAVLRL
jgi:hypothetical protein